MKCDGKREIPFSRDSAGVQLDANTITAPQLRARVVAMRANGLPEELDRYALASRDSRETTEKVLRAEMARIAAEEDSEAAKTAADRVEPDKERV